MNLVCFYWRTGIATNQNYIQESHKISTGFEGLGRWYFSRYVH